MGALEEAREQRGRGGAQLDALILQPLLRQRHHLLRHVGRQLHEVPAPHTHPAQAVGEPCRRMHFVGGGEAHRNQKPCSRCSPAERTSQEGSSSEVARMRSRGATSSARQ